MAPGGGAPSVGLALLVHALLLAALAWGVQWQHHVTAPAVQAELWAALPVEAAPPPAAAEPEPPPPTVTPPVLTPPQPSAADIALAREKARLEDQRQRDLDLQAERRAQAERDKQRQLQQAKQAEQARRERETAQKKADALRQRQQDNAATKAMERQRQENLARIAGLAGTSGNANSTGTALKSAGPSSSYAGRITARVKPNIVFLEDAPGNPAADVEVRCAPDGTIVGRRLIKSSGHKGWDEAVLKAIDKTERLPRDTDGSVYPTLVISFRPKD